MLKRVLVGSVVPCAAVYAQLDKGAALVQQVGVPAAAGGGAGAHLAFAGRSERGAEQFRHFVFQDDSVDRSGAVAVPGGGVGTAGFGQVTSTNTFARQLQFALKLIW